MKSRQLRKNALAVVGMCLLAAGIPGCEDDEPRATSNTASPPPPLPTASRPAGILSDDQIRRAVERRIAFDHSIPRAFMAVDVRDGIVELQGRVDSLLSKKRVATIAGTVRGVRTVSNRLRVDSPTRTDEKIESDVRAALAIDATSESYEVDVETRDGAVRLTGEVDSWAERDHAERVAMAVRGVVSVENGLTIRYLGDDDTRRPDDELANDVRSRLRWDTLVDDGLIVVSAEDGRVELTGKVGSLREHERAIRNAWVQGVTDVDAGGLEVDPAFARSALRSQKYVPRSDEEIRAAIEDAARYDPRLNTYHVTPSVTGGMVTLKGEVVNGRARRAAEQIARSTVGVLRVDNQIRIAPREPMSDEQVAERVDVLLRLNARTSGYDIDVAVKDGVVTLRGQVDSFAEKAEVEDVAASIVGVADVDNELEVVVDVYPYIYEPLVYRYHPVVEDVESYAVTATKLTDEQIARALEREILWDPFLTSQDIELGVANGVVRLSGTVDNFAERQSAAYLAFRVGAIAVDNDLVIAPDAG